jgi:hypothetical protein
MKHWTMGIAIYALTTAVAAANPVLNGNFESGDLSEGATPTDWIVALNDMIIPPTSASTPATTTSPAAAPQVRRRTSPTISSRLDQAMSTIPDISNRL